MSRCRNDFNYIFYYSVYYAGKRAVYDDRPGDREKLRSDAENEALAFSVYRLRDDVLSPVNLAPLRSDKNFDLLVDKVLNRR